MFEWQQHKNKNSYLRANVLCSFLLFRHNDDAVLTIFRRFLATLRRFSKNDTEHLPKITEDCRRFFEEDPKMFWWYTKEFKKNFKGTNFISAKSSISSLVRIWKIRHLSPGCGYEWCIFQYIIQGSGQKFAFILE